MTAKPKAAKAKPRKKRTGAPPASQRFKWVPDFLERLRDTCNVRDSCHAAGINRATAYAHKKRDAGFREAWEWAIEDGVDTLEFVARQRATRADGPSDVLLIFLLKAHRPEKFGDRVRMEVTVEDVRAEAEQVADDLGLDRAPIVAEAERIFAEQRRRAAR